MRRDFLFGDQATIHDVVEQQKRELQRVLEELPATAIATRSLDELTEELVERFRLDVPTLHRESVG